ncbi:hypothetical protein FF38_10205 [Lucilia cuprina]|uniref:Uncharacterized protein n=1 Tax=Lucilia cuprina TaxID=7375 RepID=A0A0L0C8D5_LUCCU|nr:hypothetical protein FF38_10205 [Lucilia cuprina]
MVKFSYVAINQKQYSTETNTSSICNYLQLQQQQTAIKTKQVPQFTNKLKFIQNNTNNTKEKVKLSLAGWYPKLLFGLVLVEFLSNLLLVCLTDNEHTPKSLTNVPQNCGECNCDATVCQHCVAYNRTGPVNLNETFLHDSS